MLFLMVIIVHQSRHSVSFYVSFSMLPFLPHYTLDTYIQGNQCPCMIQT